MSSTLRKPFLLRNFFQIYDIFLLNLSVRVEVNTDVLPPPLVAPMDSVDVPGFLWKPIGFEFLLRAVMYMKFCVVSKGSNV